MAKSISTNYNGYKSMTSSLNLSGLDLVTPVDLLKDGKSPFAKNFRLYAQQSDDRKVAVSSRKGPGYYTNTLGANLSIQSTEGGTIGDAVIDLNTQYAFKITATATEMLVGVGIRIKNTGDGSGPLIMDIHEDTTDGIGNKLTTSGILGEDIPSDYTNLTYNHFVHSIQLTSGTDYWVVIRMQDDCLGTYSIKTDTSSGTGYKTITNLSLLESLETGIVNKVYTAPSTVFKGAHRITRDNGINLTVACYGNTMYQINDSTGAITSIATGLNSSATHYSFTDIDNKIIWVNGYDVMKSWDGTTVANITDTELPILSHVVSHKDRLFGVVASDPNKIVFSENPGNPSNLATNLQWYNAWLSISFLYAPRPHHGSPVTGLESFQDSLTIFTQDGKYILDGYDRGSFYLRQSTGSKGALSFGSVARDENKIYFVSDDGFYVYNGSSDVKISEPVSPLFDGCGDKNKIHPVVWKNQVRFYLASEGSSVNDSCIIYNKDLDELLYDTDTYIDSAIYYNDADDDGQLAEFSSVLPVCYYAEQNYNSYDAPIDFEYRLKYESMGTPGQKKRIQKFFPIIQGVDRTYNLTLEMDKDFQDSPKSKNILLATNGATWDNFTWDSGVTYGGGTSFKQHKQSFSGYAYYWQPRISRYGINNRVAFIGAQYTYKTKKL